MKAGSYNRFYEPFKDVFSQLRALFYQLATQFINQAKNISYGERREDTNTIKVILLLLYTWSFASKEINKVKFQNVGELIRHGKDDLKYLQKCSTRTAKDCSLEVSKIIFAQFIKLLGETITSKALSLMHHRYLLCVIPQQENV